MRNQLFVKTVLHAFVTGLLSLGIQTSAYAAMIGTDALIAEQDRKIQITNITEFLGRNEVRDQLMTLGVDPDAAATRVASLSPTELQTLDDQLRSAPAGGTGILEVLGITFVVLLVLELTGVIDIFKKT